MSFRAEELDAVTKKASLRNEIQHRADNPGESLAGSIERSWDSADSSRDLQRIVQRYGT
jgi:hypothetical protein